jgi:tetratricopeptide (TPR) repeat protein
VDDGKRLAATSLAQRREQARRRAGRGHLSLMDVAKLLDAAPGSEGLALALVELEARSPFWRRGMTRLRELSRDFRNPHFTQALAEAKDAPALWRELAALPDPERLAAVETQARFQIWGLCRFLQCRSVESADRDPEAAAPLANLAARIARHLGAGYDPALLPDYRALSLCGLGNAWRALGELGSAGDAFDLAETLRRGGSGYPEFEAETAALRALLRRDQGRLEEAIDLLDGVEAIYGAAAEEVAEPDLYDRERHAEARVHRGWCLYHLGRVEAAAAALEAATSLLVEPRQRRLVLAARCGLLWCSLTLGRPDVEKRLAAAYQLAGRVGDEADRLRLDRAQARIDARLGERGPAEQALRHAAQRFAELDLGIEAALAHLDLAALYVGQGAGDAVRHLGGGLEPGVSASAAKAAPFSVPNAQRAKMEALLLVLQGCAVEQLTPERLAGIAAVVERELRPSPAWWSGVKTLPFTGGGGGDAGATLH